MMNKCKKHNGNSGCNRPTNNCFTCWEAFIENHPQAHVGAKDLLNIMRSFKEHLKEKDTNTETLKSTVRKTQLDKKLENGHVEYLESVLEDKGVPGKGQEVENLLIKTSLPGNICKNGCLRLDEECSCLGE